MPKQPAIPGLRDAMKKKMTRREQFLAEMDAVVPWTRLLALIAPHYPKVVRRAGAHRCRWRPCCGCTSFRTGMRLSDPMAEETLYDSEAMRRFAGIELGDDRIPDETTILNFRHLLERHGLTEAIFAEVNGHLADKGITCARARWWMRPSSTRRRRRRTRPRHATPRCRQRRRAMPGTSE
jgi:IS5 family transposase